MWDGLGFWGRGSFDSVGWCQRCTKIGAVTREAGKVTRDKQWEQLLGRGNSILPDGAWHLYGTELLLKAWLVGLHSDGLTTAISGRSVQKSESFDLDRVCDCRSESFRQPEVNVKMGSENRQQREAVKCKKVWGQGRQQTQTGHLLVLLGDAVVKSTPLTVPVSTITYKTENSTQTLCVPVSVWEGDVGPLLKTFLKF